jgi:DNA-binding transcriptional LysR family regulator
MMSVDTRRLPYLVEFARHGSMRVVAEVLGTSTSVVSQQIAALAQEVGAALVEPAGRRSRLTPEGRRLAEHARTILAAVETAELDLDPDAEPHGVVRVAGFATAVRRAVVPTVTALAATHPQVALTIREYEPAEAHAMLAADEIDLALTYDYDLAPAALDPDLTAIPLWSADWGLAVPSAEAPSAADALDALGVVAAFAHRDWIGNSRNRADEQVLRTLASMAGVAPRLTHEADSLELVEDLILAGLGVGLLPRDRRPRPGVEVLALTTPGVRLRAYAVTRRGRAGWPALALVLARIEHRADRR